MDNNKGLMIVKNSFLKKILNKLKNLLKKDKRQKEINGNNHQSQTKNEKNNFFDSIRVGENSEVLYLKIKLENDKIKAIDLTDEQIDELQKIYDKEIEKKKNIIKKLKNIA